MRWLGRQEEAGSMTAGGGKRWWQPVTGRRKRGQKQACAEPRLCHAPLEAKLCEKPRPRRSHAPGEATGKQWTCTVQRCRVTPC